MKTSTHLLKIVTSALLAALCCVATIAIQIPTPTGGFLNMGDAVVILSAWLMGPVYGTLAAGIGSALADIFAGYVQYAPATFIIKALMAVVTWLVLYLFKNLCEKKYALSLVFTALAGVCAECVMVLGYFCYEAVLLQYGLGAAASVLPNTIQGCAGIVAGTLLVALLSKTKIKEKFLK
ncbi:MAG: ECF transporter S component [Clostridia bacterium]|nr:ECF transporter S component [Clostridia bacterium]